MKATLLIKIVNGNATFKYGEKDMPIKVSDSPKDGQYVISGKIRQGKSGGRLTEVWINPTSMISIAATQPHAPSATAAAAKKTSSKSQAKTSKTNAKQPVDANPFA